MQRPRKNPAIIGFDWCPIRITECIPSKEGFIAISLGEFIEKVRPSTYPKSRTFLGIDVHDSVENNGNFVSEF